MQKQILLPSPEEDQEIGNHGKGLSQERNMFSKEDGG